MFCVLLARQPLVISYQGSDLNPFVHSNRLRSPVGRILSQIAALRATRMICVSAQLKKALWWRQSRASVIPSGVDTTVFTPLRKQEARTALGWAEQDRVVVSSAGTDPQRKRLDLAQSAVALAERICGKIRLVVLEGRTEQKDIAIMFSAADCLLLTSDREGSPNIVKEAMACNLPVISVDVGDVRERLQSVIPSRIVTRDPSDIAQALVEFVTSPKRSNGAEMMIDLSAENVARQVLNLYQEALAHEPSSQRL
jgi:glycosyltransferase involved in cell wall biosynthesis